MLEALRDSLASLSLEVFSIFTLMITIFLGAKIPQALFRNGIKQAIKVAVIGQPRAGKTTLITVVFDQIISSKLARNIRVDGTKTVERITNYLSILRGGGQIDPTQDKDVFAYRYTATKNRIVKFRYDIEVADFPGEYSLALNEGPTGREVLNTGLVGKEFFSWVLNADRYIFVIDLSKAMEYSKRTSALSEDDLHMSVNREYIERTEALIKNSVLTLKQELLDADVYLRPVMLVFSKTDKIFYSKSKFAVGDSNLEGQVTLTSRTKVEGQTREEFSALFQFLEANFKNVDCVFHSSYLARDSYKTETEKLVSFMSP